MVESSRLFLWTEYARKGCGVIEEHGTDYKVWEALPVSHSPLAFFQILIDYRTGSPQTNELKNFSHASRKTKSPRSKEWLPTTLVVSLTARTQVTLRVCIQRTWTTSKSLLKQMVSMAPMVFQRNSVLVISQQHSFLKR